MEPDEDRLSFHPDLDGLGCWMLLLGVPFLAGMFFGGWLVVQAAAH